MGGSRSSNKIEETSAEKAASKVAVEQWNLYNDELKQFEDEFISRIDNYNSSSNMADTKANVNLSYNKQYGDAREATSDQLMAAGVDPSSGKYQSTLSSLATDQVVKQGDTINRAQVNEQDKYVVGLQDVVAVGMGEKSEGLAGMSDTSSLSLNKATNDAYNDFNTRAGNAQAIGSLAGMGLAAYTAPTATTAPNTTFKAMQEGSQAGYSPMGSAGSYGLND